MKLLKSYEKLPAAAKGCVIVIGNFDGVHKGHQALLNKAKEIAQTEGMKLGILTFEPHPRRLFRPDEPPARITPLPLKAKRLEEEGIDYLFAVPFDWDFASQSFEEFISNILQKGLKASHIVVGYDFRFGQMRKGTPEDIISAGIPVTVIKEVGENLSSSAVRQALRGAEIEKATDMLGWEWEIWGEIVHGDKRGREIGYPTANVPLGETIHPSYGVYAARVMLEGETKWRNAAVNIGIRPMFEVEEAQLEAYIFDFDAEIYGQTLRIKPVKRLRSEARFDALDDLITQIKEDCMQARTVLEVSL